MSGIVRDVVNAFVQNGDSHLWGVASGYIAVYVLEILLLLVTIGAAYPLIKDSLVKNTATATHTGAADANSGSAA